MQHQFVTKIGKYPLLIKYHLPKNRKCCHLSHKATKKKTLSCIVFISNTVLYIHRRNVENEQVGAS